MLAPASQFTSLLTLALAVALGGVTLSTQVTALPSASTHLTRRATVCNGHAELCDRLYSNVTYIGTHNSYAIGKGLSNIAANQAQSITTQLNAGVRMLQAQVHNQNGALQLCHTSCSLLDGGTLESWLNEIKKWLDSNPDEVLSLLLVNSDNVAPSTFSSAFDSSGMTSLMYTADSSSASASGGISKNSWPTLNSMISSGKRVVAYLASEGDINSVPYLLPEFSSIWENAYDQTTTSFNCTIDRSGQGEDTSNQMYLANFFKANSLGSLGTVPDTKSIYTTNSQANLLQSAYGCASQHGNVAPTFILVDYYNYPQGDVFATAAQLNGVSYDNSTSSKSEGSSGSGSSSGAIGQFAPSALLALIGSTAIALAMGLA